MKISVREVIQRLITLTAYSLFSTFITLVSSGVLQANASEPSFFTKQALQKIHRKIDDLQRVSPFVIDINFTTFQLNVSSDLPKKILLSHDLQKDLTAIMVHSNAVQKLTAFHNEAVQKQQLQIIAANSIQIIFSIGEYYDYATVGYKKKVVGIFGLAAGNNVTSSVTGAVEGYPMQLLDAQSTATNDNTLIEFVNHLEQLLLPEKNKAYILYSNRKYFTNDTLYVSASEQTVQLHAYTHTGEPFNNDTQWQGAISGNDKSISSLKMKEPSLNGAGTFVKASTKNYSVSIHVVAVRVDFTYSFETDGVYGFDDNDQKLCIKYPSYYTTPVEGRPWQLIPANNQFIPVAVSVLPTDCASKFTFFCSNGNAFRLKSPRLSEQRNSNSVLSEWQLHIASNSKNAETAIVPNINGIAFKNFQLNVVAYEKKIMEVSVVLIAEENDDVQAVPWETEGLDPMTITVRAGKNKFLDTNTIGDDQIITDSQTGEAVIIAGPNGRCDSFANDTHVPPDVLFDATEFEASLNQRYVPYMIEWKVDKTILTRAVNYDANNDRVVNMAYYDRQTKKWMEVEEEDRLFQQRNTSKMYHLLLAELPLVSVVNEKPAGKVTGGFHGSESATAAIIAVSTIRASFPKTPPDRVYETGAHELAHVAFSLDDLYTIRDAPFRNDVANVMNGGLEGVRPMEFRKFQWDIMHGVQPPESQDMLYK